MVLTEHFIYTDVLSTRITLFNEHGCTRKFTDGENSPPWIRRGRGGLTLGILLFCTNLMNDTNVVKYGTDGNSFYTDDSF